MLQDSQLYFRQFFGQKLKKSSLFSVALVTQYTLFKYEFLLNVDNNIYTFLTFSFFLVAKLQSSFAKEVIYLYFNGLFGLYTRSQVTG